MEDNIDISHAVPETEDPIEYLLKKPEYHEWQIVVKDDSGAEEVFGVQASHLSAHSLFFRTMLTDPKWITSKTVEISDISPQIFRMIFGFVNGGGLPQMSKEEAVQLALAADMYMMPRLKKKACKRLVPSNGNVQDVFMALRVVPYISAPDLDPAVVKILQNKTKEVFDSAGFLTLDKQQLEHIFKQDAMSVTEVEVWKSLVKWGKNQVSEDDGEKTLRSIIEDLLKFVRLHILTQEEIVKEVKPTKVLTDSELLSLFCAVASKQPWNQPGFCDVQAARKLTTIEDPTNEVRVFKILGSLPGQSETITAVTSETKSCFTINTLKDIELVSFMVKPSAELKGEQFYNIDSVISVKVSYQDSYQHFTNMTTKKLVFVGDTLLSLPAKLVDGRYLRLKANNKYVLTLTLSPAHPAFLTTTTYNQVRPISTTKEERKVIQSKFCYDTNKKIEYCVMTVQHNTAFHVQEIHYRVLP